MVTTIEMVEQIKDILMFNSEMSVVLFTMFVVLLLIYLNYDRVENIFMLLRLIAVVVFLIAVVFFYLTSKGILGIPMKFILSFLSGAVFLLFVSFLFNLAK